MLKLKEIIESKMLIATTSVGASSGSTADEIEKLAALRDRGILTAEEFQSRKKSLLSIRDRL